MFRKTVFTVVSLTMFLIAFSNAGNAQHVSLNYQYRLEPVMITTAPEMIGTPQIAYPDEARKNGVEGTLTAYFTIAEDGTTKNITIEKSLPFGVDSAVTAGLQRLRFKPAKVHENTVAVRMYFDYRVSAVYSERDSNVSKPKITAQPDPVYPQKYSAEKLKGEVLVILRCSADGKVFVIGVSSVMPKEFDRAAREAAEKIIFEPAVHKKSKKPVSQEMTVKYKFKP